MNQPRLTVLTNVYNEEYLLPFWLEHHKDLFDHGIVVDYNSTDKSIEIIRQYCPTWEIITTKNKAFGAIEIDKEFMELEKNISGYKIVLNTTEFLLSKIDIRTVLPNIKNQYIEIESLNFLSTKDNYYPNTLNDLFSGIEYISTVSGKLKRSPRYLHSYESGNYRLGRHNASYPITLQIPAYIGWFGFYPWNDKIIERRLQIKNQIPESDKKVGYSYHHFWDVNKMLEVKNYYFSSCIKKEEIDYIIIPTTNTNTNFEQKILAYYFPQFHSIPENDLIFGKNFTDWEIFKKKEPKELLLHKQPLQPPNGLGYYNPINIEVRKEQASLAKKYGIDGFIYYHYWLENHPVMNKILDKIIEDNEPNIPFSICFANQSWVHNYGFTNNFKSLHPDGTTFRQLYDKPEDHAQYLQKLFKHPNYIKINNAPILYIYIYDSDVSSYLRKICNELKKYDIHDVYIIACTSIRCLQNYNSKITSPNAYSPFIIHDILNSNKVKLPESLSKLPCMYGGAIGWNSQLRHPNYKKILDYKPVDITKNVCRDLLTMKYDINSPQIYTLFAWNEWTEGAVIEPNTIYGEDIGNAIKKGRNIVDLLCNDNKFVNTIFEYGKGSIFANITKNVYINCIQYMEIDKNNYSWVIYIPKNDYVRPKLVGDPLPGVNKVIKVLYNGITTIYDDTKEIIIELCK